MSVRVPITLRSDDNSYEVKTTAIWLPLGFFVPDGGTHVGMFKVNIHDESFMVEWTVHKSRVETVKSIEFQSESYEIWKRDNSRPVYVHVTYDENNIRITDSLKAKAYDTATWTVAMGLLI